MITENCFLAEERRQSLKNRFVARKCHGKPSVPKGMTKITDALLIKNPIDLSQCLCESPGGWRQANFGHSAIRCWGVANLHPENASISTLRQHEYPRQSFIQSHHAVPAGLQTWVVAVTKMFATQTAAALSVAPVIRNRNDFYFTGKNREHCWGCHLFQQFTASC